MNFFIWNNGRLIINLNQIAVIEVFDNEFRITTSSGDWLLVTQEEYYKIVDRINKEKHEG